MSHFYFRFSASAAVDPNTVTAQWFSTCECAGTIYVCVFALASACEVSLTSARAIRSVTFRSSVSFYFVLDSSLHLCFLALSF